MMTRQRAIATCGALLLGMLTFGSFAGGTADNLGDVLRESGWDRIIGEWVDAETKGARIRVVYAWRFDNRLIEVTAWEGQKETVSLMGRNPKSGEVFHVSADNEGGSSIGKWEIEDGEASLSILFVTGKGEEGGLRLRHRLEDDDTMIITVELPIPFKVKMVRAKPKSDPDSRKP